MFFYLCENLAGTWQQWYWLVNQNEEQLVYLSVNHNVNCNFSILCCWAWSILSSWWWPYCSTPSGNDDLSSHFWRHFLLNRQGCAADKHYSLREKNFSFKSFVTSNAGIVAWLLRSIHWSTAGSLQRWT